MNNGASGGPEKDAEKLKNVGIPAKFITPRMGAGYPRRRKSPLDPL
jgi:hypothetical protein